MDNLFDGHGTLMSHLGKQCVESARFQRAVLRNRYEVLRRSGVLHSHVAAFLSDYDIAKAFQHSDQAIR